MDEDCHATRQAIYKGVQGADWENSYYKYVDVHEAVNREKLGISEKAKALWSMRDAKANGEACHDPRSERQIEGRTPPVQQALWEARVRSPTAALGEALW